MPLNLPATVRQIATKAKTDIRLAWKGSNPFLKNSLVGALADSFSNRVFDFYGILDNAIDQSFGDTATGDFLERHAAEIDIFRNAATKSVGNIIASGDDTSVILIGSGFLISGVAYTSTATVAITATSLAVTTLTRTVSTATCTTTLDHNLAVGSEVVMSGAVETAYNGTFTITNVTALNVFEYTVPGNPGSPATGTILADHVTIPVPVESDEFQDSENNINVNQLSGAALSVQSPIAGVDSTLLVDFSEIGGGTDQEVDDDFRSRYLFKKRNPIANFNSSAIVTYIRQNVPGVTRVFVEEATPAEGEVTIYFMRDNDATAVPSAGEITVTKNALLVIKPAQNIDDDIIFPTLTGVVQPFTFSELNPNTVAMKKAVTASLVAFYAEVPVVNKDIKKEKYEQAISNTVDEGGNPVINFALSAPTADITITSGQIGQLGAVTYP